MGLPATYPTPPQEAGSGCGGVWLTPGGRADDGTLNESCPEEARRTRRLRDHGGVTRASCTPVLCSKFPEQCSQTGDISEVNLRGPSHPCAEASGALPLAAQAPLPAVGVPAHPCLRVTRGCHLLSAWEASANRSPVARATVLSRPALTHFPSYLPSPSLE